MAKKSKAGTITNTRIVVGRNDMCYCGSKKKYKNCHGKALPDQLRLDFKELVDADLIGEAIKIADEASEKIHTGIIQN